ncbi:hypothetical protein SVA_2842 [Sulfurifustis variabilis]|uniref:Uncharacterized protein n=1 Tax=Sulfurifustis variabilis TaxID=1675686 RepID=A0A1B4V784_9GAMM|nr:hypothetical protein [Sulfurifustis variabilis]BAU49390.1 hypothetical protein SVA_2842 [Sulfurifustis variabilis]
MYLFFSLIPATLWVVLGYFILFTSSKAQGQLQTFGRILAIVVFAIGALFPLLGAYATFAGLSPMGAMESMHSGARP